MKYSAVPVGAKNARDTETWVCYIVASLRAEGTELARLDFGQPDPIVRARVRSGVLKTLRRLKREAKIRFFLASEELDENRTETEYLYNKYPAVAEDPAIVAGTHDCILVCL